MMEQTQNQEDARIAQLMAAAYAKDKKARQELEQLGYELVSVCSRCGAEKVGRDHALNCMGSLRAEWVKKKT
jgi:hypothetical protein